MKLSEKLKQFLIDNNYDSRLPEKVSSYLDQMSDGFISANLKIRSLLEKEKGKNQELLKIIDRLTGELGEKKVVTTELEPLK